jgi:hypothetical protein
MEERRTAGRAQEPIVSVEKGSGNLDESRCK